MKSFLQGKMCVKIGISALFYGLFATCAYGQAVEDSLQNVNASEIVVTATRSGRSIAELPISVAVVQGVQIGINGSARLNNVLEEMTGLSVSQDHGNGIQIQGLDPDYTLILIDEAPVIGRTAGTLDLSRIAAGDISRIEIVKGPSSSLYGSEALAGVINIITKTPTSSSGKIESQYGTNATLDLAATASIVEDGFKVSLTGDYFRTEGYDLTPDDGMKTVDPYSNYTIFSKASYPLGAGTFADISARYYHEKQNPFYIIELSAGNGKVSGDGIVTDLSITPHVSHFITDELKADIHLYSSLYTAKSDLRYESDGSIYDDSFFDQTLLRPEFMLEYVFSKNNTLTVGGGYSSESVKATRYEGTKSMGNLYTFAQYDWIPFNDLNIITGLRYDNHTAYPSQFSPKLSARYSLNEMIAFRGSLGSGFKAPDFRQLYLTFTNPVAGYSVFGSQEVASGVAKLESDGQISEVLLSIENFGDVRPESSLAYNLGLQVTDSESSMSAEANIFYNHVKDLIDTEPVARKTNGQMVFSYINKNRVATYGAELNGSWKLTSAFTFSLGYQYLHAVDLDVVDALAGGKVYRRDPETLLTERVPESEYGGLFNRSKHMANAKIYFQDQKSGVDISLRNIFKGRYGFADKNGNQILDADNEYAPGYFQMNISLRKSFPQKFYIQFGCDNLLNYTSAEYTPMIAGRLLWAKIGISIN